jgi:hypothetical protein
MAYESLQAVIGTAVIDPVFRKALLNGSRRRVLSTFRLTHEEIDAVMKIRADSLEQFASELDQWITAAQGKPNPPVLRLPILRTSPPRV